MRAKVWFPFRITLKGMTATAGGTAVMITNPSTVPLGNQQPLKPESPSQEDVIQGDAPQGRTDQFPGREKDAAGTPMVARAMTRPRAGSTVFSVHFAPGPITTPAKGP